MCPVSSVQFSRSVVSDSLWPHESQHTRPPCPSPTPGVYLNSCPSSWWCHPVISCSVISFFSCPQSLPASGSFPMSQLFAWGGQSIEVSASASVLPMNTQDWSALGWTGWISLQSKGLSRVFSNTTVQKNHIRYLFFSFWFVVVQFLSCVWLFVIQWTASHQASLSFSIGFTSLCIIGSGFIHLIRPDSNEFLFCGWVILHCIYVPWLLYLSEMRTLRWDSLSLEAPCWSWTGEVAVLCSPHCEPVLAKSCPSMVVLAALFFHPAPVMR